MNLRSWRRHHAIHQAGKKLERRDGFEIMKGKSGRRDQIRDFHEIAENFPHALTRQPDGSRPDMLGGRCPLRRQGGWDRGSVGGLRTDVADRRGRFA